VQRNLAVSGSPVVDAAGRVTLAVMVFRDVTELRKLEATRRQYVSLLSHDLRGPLLAAKLNGELLIKAGGTPALHDLSTRIVDSLSHLDDMVRALLDAERLGAGKTLTLELEDCDAVAIARDAIADLEPLYGPRFRLEGDQTLRGLWGHRELYRALWNLASNAGKYGSSEAPIVIRLERREGYAWISVHNRGPVIPADEQERLSQPFFRTRSAQAELIRGWGLGLTQVRACAEAHGGKLRVRSDASEGTTFTLQLAVKAPEPGSGEH
jgi:signal transduction histidine kinase